MPHPHTPSTVQDHPIRDDGSSNTARRPHPYLPVPSFHQRSTSSHTSLRSNFELQRIGVLKRVDSTTPIAHPHQHSQIIDTNSFLPSPSLLPSPNQGTQTASSLQHSQTVDTNSFLPSPSLLPSPNQGTQTASGDVEPRKRIRGDTNTVEHPLQISDAPSPPDTMTPGNIVSAHRSHFKLGG
jgi:hypothetical protein